MPRYLIKRTFPAGLDIPMDSNGAGVCRAVVNTNAADGVTWIHSYVSTDGKTTHCIYDGPSTDAIRRAAENNQQPVDQITEVRVLDPYFYQPS